MIGEKWQYMFYFIFLDILNLSGEITRINPM